jgi:hypothetical protein
MTSDSSNKLSAPSNATSEREVDRRIYQRKVPVTFTRAEADLVRRLLLSAATNKYASEVLGLRGTDITRARRAWKRADRQIRRRDEAMKQKRFNRTYESDTVEDDEVDVPLEGLE